MTPIRVLVLSLSALAATTSAIDYLGGWQSSSQCVDICVKSKATPTCFTSAPSCVAKQQRPKDYDYLTLEQTFVPQFCRDLRNGTDSTVSHQHVLPMDQGGLQCVAQRAVAKLTIHGLWPNYNDGYPACCNVTDTIANQPLPVDKFFIRHKQLAKKMERRWIDATQATTNATLCEIYNHEFQKHGLCYNAFGNDMETAAVTYFTDTLKVADTLEKATNKIESWAEKHATPSLNDVNALYKNKVQVLCSAVGGGNKLLAIRSCFAKPEQIPSQQQQHSSMFKQIDCAPATAGALAKPCSNATAISLDAYQA